MLTAAWQVRNDHNGEIVYKDYFNGAITGIVEADYRLDGRSTIICTSKDGEVRGYLPTDAAEGATPESLQSLNDVARELAEKKASLLAELGNYSAGIKQQGKKGGPADANLIPADTRLEARLEPNPAAHCVELVLSTNNYTVIQLVAVFAEQLFDGESLVAEAPGGTPEPIMRVRLALPRDVSTTMSVKVLVGNRGSQLYHVFELEQKLPKFAMYAPSAEPAGATPTASVIFQVNEQLRRVQLWATEAFAAPDTAFAIGAGGTTLNARFDSLRPGGGALALVLDAASGRMTVFSDSVRTHPGVYAASAFFFP